MSEEGLVLELDMENQGKQPEEVKADKPKRNGKPKTGAKGDAVRRTAPPPRKPMVLQGDKAAAVMDSALTIAKAVYKPGSTLEQVWADALAASKALNGMK